MRRALATIAVLAVFAPGASAATTSVKGSGNISKLTLDNAQRAVKVTLAGLGDACEARNWRVELSWGKPNAYAVEAGCYPGGTWRVSLVYLTDRQDRNTSKLKDCAKLKATYGDGKWRVTVPRKCIGKAADRLRAAAEGVDYSSAIPGEAGPTKRVARG